MAISKIILNGVTQMDTTQVTVDSSNLFSGFTALGKDGEILTGAAEGLPTYIHHAIITPSENTRSFSLTIGTGVRLVVFTSNHNTSTSPSVMTVIGGNIVIQANNSFYPSGCRLNCLTTSNGSTYYTTNSNGGQSWTYSDGVLSILNTSGWWMEGGTRYDFFWA